MSLLLPLAVAFALAGCASAARDGGSLFGLVTPYRIDIVQGNVVTKEQMARVRPGMTRQQVRDVLGTPLVTDLFHAERWDYPFTIRRQGAEPQQRSVIAHFKGDTLERIEAPELPSEHEFVASISVSRRTPSAVKLELSDEERQALPVPPPRPAPAVEPTGPQREYPPLEGRS